MTAFGFPDPTAQNCPGGTAQQIPYQYPAAQDRSVQTDASVEVKRSSVELVQANAASSPISSAQATQ